MRQRDRSREDQYAYPSEVALPAVSYCVKFDDGLSTGSSSAFKRSMLIVVTEVTSSL
jgi:hypothetical protein